jgi:hypothetical protein
MLGVVVLLVVAGVAVALQGVDRILSWVIQPSVPLGLIAFNVLLLAFRVFAVIDAYRTHKAGSWTAETQPAPGQSSGGIPTLQAREVRSPVTRVLVGAALVLLLFLTIAPHAVAGYYLYLSRDLLTTVFVEEETTTTSSSLPVSTTTSLPTASSTSSTMGVTTTSLTTTTATTDG